MTEMDQGTEPENTDGGRNRPGELDPENTGHDRNGPGELNPVNTDHD